MDIEGELIKLLGGTENFIKNEFAGGYDNFADDAKSN